MSSAPRPALEGRSLGEFTLRDKIGEGGFAAVYRAYQPTLEREAVVKVLHARLAGRADITQRFLREAKLASRLDHPYAAHVYAFGAEPDGTLWIAMELVRGTPMDSLLEQQGTIALERFVPLFERICEVVQSAHERGLIHRDLKPANVMVLSRAGRLLPKLLDFGIARVSDDDSTGTGDDEPTSTRATRTGAVMGSPLYMAPEQWADAGTVGTATDIYALGVLAYEALTGRTPFPQATLDELLVAHARAEVPPLGDDLPVELYAVLARALAKQPADRYASAGDFAAAIRAATGSSDAELLPTLDDALRDMFTAGAPQPLAEAITTLEAARNIDRASALVGDVIAVVARWLGVLALAARTKIGPGNDADGPDVREHLRALGRGTLGDDEWIALACSLTKPFARRSDVHPLPELVRALHGGSAPPEVPFVDAFRELRALRGSLERRAGRDDDEARALYAATLAALASVLRRLQFLLDYTVVVIKKRCPERWRGLRRHSRATFVRRAKPLPEGEVFLLAADGYPMVQLSPLIQACSPAPGKDDELFLFDGCGPLGARLVATPRGFERVDAELDAWIRRLLDLATDGTTPLSDEIAPYRGLAPFTSSDSELYFGREREVEAFVNRLRVEPFLAVVGPSGTGKSSFVQAGVMSRVPSGWRAIVVRPGPSPVAALAARLDREGIGAGGSIGDRLRAAASDGGVIVLVVDQLEELFTLCRDRDERRRFAEVLADAARADTDPVRVVVTLRDDFLIRAEAEEPLRERLARGLKLLTTPAKEDLERILMEPARRAGYQFEDRALVEEMVAEVEGQFGALALLSFTAAELWKLRDRHFHQLSRRSYLAIGGVGGALARHAEAMLAELSSDEQRIVREAFRHLVTAEGTRQVLQLEELRQLLDEKRGVAVINKLVAARLVVVSEEAGGDDRMEIIHEALLEAWPRLVEWRREDAEGARLRDQLRTAAKQWNSRGRPRGLLWRTEALTEYQLWRARYPGALTDIETAFGQASEADAARGRRNRRLLLGLAFAVLVAGVVGLIVFNTRVAGQRARAEAATRDLEITLQRQYEDQGRRLVLAKDSLQALAYLDKARELGASGKTHDFLVAQAVRATDGKLFEVRHDNEVWRAAFSPDGNWLVTGGWDRQARVWNARTGEAVRTLPHSDTVSSVAFSPDQRWILTSSFSGSAFVWEVATGTRVLELAHGGRVRCARFSRDGSLAITAGDDGTLAVWALPRGQQTLRVRGSGAGVTACAVSSDGALVVAGDSRGTIRIWDSQAGTLRHELRDQQAAIRTLEFAADGPRLLSASMDGTAIEWDSITGRATHVFAHGGPIRQARYSADGRSIVTASSDRNAIVWDALLGTRRFVLSGHKGGVEAAVFSPDGKYIVTCSEDATVGLWEAATGRSLARWLGHQDTIVNAVFDASGGRVVTTGVDGAAIVWRVAPQQQVKWLHGASPQLVLNAAFSRDGATVLTVDNDRALAWDSVTGRHTHAALRDVNLRDASFGPDPRHVLTASDTGVGIWDLETGTRLHTISADPATSVAWSADGNSILAMTRSGFLRCWDARTMRLRFERRAHEGYLMFIAVFDQSGSRIVSTGDDLTVRIWSIDGQLLLEHRDDDNPLTAAFDPSGVRVLSLISRKRIKIWNIHTRRTEVELAGHSAKIYSTDWSSDGSRVTTSAADGTIRLWDAVTGDTIAIFEHPGRTRLGWLSPLGDQILITGEDGSAALYVLPRYDGTPAQLEQLMRCRVPFTVDGDHLRPRPRDPRCTASPDAH